MAGNFFRGTSVEQDGRWGKSDEKLMAKMAKNGMFSPILETKVNLKKINLDVINKWITQKIIEVVGFEDDILINLVINMLQATDIDGRKMQLDVTGFLEKQSGAFIAELWTLLVDAQEQPSGIPSVFLQKKKDEILQRQELSKRFSSTQSTTVINSLVSGPETQQVRAESASKSDNNSSKLHSKEDSSRDVKDASEEPRKRERSASRSPDRRHDRRRDERPRERSPDRRDRSPDRGHRDRDHRTRRDDRRSERDERDRDRHSDRRRDSRDRHDRHKDRDGDRHRDRHGDRREDRRNEHRRDRSPDRRESHRDRRSPERRRPREDSRERKHHHHHHRDRSLSGDRRGKNPRSRSPERRHKDRDSSSDRDEGTKDIKRSPSRDSSSDRDMDKSVKLSVGDCGLVAEESAVPFEDIEVAETTHEVVIDE